MAVDAAAAFDNINWRGALLQFVEFVRRGADPAAVAALRTGLDDLVLIGLYMLCLEPALRLFFRLALLVQTTVRRLQLLRYSGQQQMRLGPLESSAAASAVAFLASPPRFEGSLFESLRTPARNFGWCLLALWALDSAYLLAATVGLVKRGSGKWLRAVGSLAYTFSAGQALMAYKNLLVRNAATRARRKQEEAASMSARRKLGGWLSNSQHEFLLSRGLGLLLWVVLGFACAESISQNIGVGLGSLLSFAGIGGIAFGFAMKDLLENLVGGCLLYVSNPFIPGDKIKITNLESSRVLRIGWYQTIVVGDDEQRQTIPNAKFISNKVSNLSRRTHRRVKQSIYIDYEALADMETIMADLREALGNLPTVDLSRNFRVFLKSFTQTAIEVEIEVHFVGGGGTEFRGKREGALLAISNVLKTHGASFAVLNGLITGPTSERGGSAGTGGSGVTVATGGQ